MPQEKQSEVVLPNVLPIEQPTQSVQAEQKQPVDDSREFMANTIARIRKRKFLHGLCFVK